MKRNRRYNNNKNTSIIEIINDFLSFCGVQFLEAFNVTDKCRNLGHQYILCHFKLYNDVVFRDSKSIAKGDSIKLN